MARPFIEAAMSTLIVTEELRDPQAAAPGSTPAPEVTQASATGAPESARSPWTSFASVRVLVAGIVAIAIATGAFEGREQLADRTQWAGVSEAGVAVALDLEQGGGRGHLELRTGTSVCSGPLRREEARGRSTVFAYRAVPGCAQGAVELRELASGLELRLIPSAGGTVRALLEPINAPGSPPASAR